jgi:hypothetical protein
VKLPDTLIAMRRTKLIVGKHYIVELPPTLVEAAMRLQAIYKDGSGIFIKAIKGRKYGYFNFYNGMCRDVKDVTNWWPLPPDGNGLGEVAGSSPLEMKNSGWNRCSKCKGKGCQKCGNLGKILAPGFILCSNCDGFGSVGCDDNDPLDMGSFQENCGVCKGNGSVKKKDKEMNSLNIRIRNMNQILVTIRGKQYVASKRRCKRRSDVYHAVFRPVGKRETAFIAYDAIECENGLVGGQNAMGPFGSPSRTAKVYNVKGYGRLQSLTQRAFDFIAKQFEKEVVYQNLNHFVS